MLAAEANKVSYDIGSRAVNLPSGFNVTAEVVQEVRRALLSALTSPLAVDEAGEGSRDVGPITPVGAAPLISIGLPTFNRANSLRRAIESVLSQDYPEIELDYFRQRLNRFNGKYLQGVRRA